MPKVDITATKPKVIISLDFHTRYATRVSGCITGIGKISANLTVRWLTRFFPMDLSRWRGLLCVNYVSATQVYDYSYVNCKFLLMT